MLESPRARLVGLLALFALPIAVSLGAYFLGGTDRRSNYGELLLPPATITEAALDRGGGQAFRFSELRGRWVLVGSDSGACPESCRAKLVLMRQVRLALGRNASRIERVYVADDIRAVDRAGLADHPGLVVVSLPIGMSLPTQAVNDRAHIYLVDPNGNVMMRFPADAEPRRMYRDLDRLLRASQIG